MVGKTSKICPKNVKICPKNAKNSSKKSLVVVTSSSANLSVVDSTGSANLSQIILSCQSVDQNGCNSVDYTLNQSASSAASVHVYNLKPGTAYVFTVTQTMILISNQTQSPRKAGSIQPPPPPPPGDF